MSLAAGAARNGVTMKVSPQFLSPTAQTELLALARRTLAAYLTSADVPPYIPANPELGARAGAFVTLRHGSELRGCIGNLTPEEGLFHTVQRCAVSAAAEDLRFRPVVLSELPELRIEISVLTPARRVRNVSEVEVGRHGLIVTRGSRRGLLLPQVATDYAWDRDTFLAQTCRKAGLTEDTWRDPSTVIEVFSAQVFGEKD